MGLNLPMYYGMTEEEVNYKMGWIQNIVIGVPVDVFVAILIYNIATKLRGRKV